MYTAIKDTDSYKQVKILDALEILITPENYDDQKALPFLSWEMVGFTTDQIFI